MRSYLSLAALVLALSVAACVDHTGQQPAVVGQKPSGQYTPSYRGAKPPDGTVISTSPLTHSMQANAAQSAPPTPPQTPQTQARVAILLPLSGKNAALGQAMLNAAQQAVFDAAGNNFELQPHDTAGEGGAAEAARVALAAGSQLIIGPLFAGDVPPVEALAENKAVQILPLSTDTSLAEPGVYIMGLAPGAQVERVVSYAAAHGAHHFAALIPATPYGSLVGQVFADAVTRAGGIMVDFETVDLTSADSAQRVKAIAAQHASIDALFVPLGGSDLKLIADQLTAAGFDGVHTHILGTGLWDGQNVGRLSPMLPGAWYAAPDAAARHTFAANYTSAYGQDPPRLATLAYDATALAAVLAKQGGHYDQKALTNPNGFAGLDGIFRLLPSGVVERGLAVNEVTAEGARVIDPAPASFVGKK